jgi:hypothetical protein
MILIRPSGTCFPHFIFEQFTIAQVISEMLWLVCFAVLSQQVFGELQFTFNQNLETDPSPTGTL